MDADIADPNGDAEQSQIEEGETDIPEEVDELHAMTLRRPPRGINSRSQLICP